MTDQLTPEDRALHDAFFEAYREKYKTLSAVADPGAEISLDACTVAAIVALINNAYSEWSEAWSFEADALADELAELQELEAMECPEDFVNAHGRVVFGRAAGVIRDLVSGGPARRPAPRIVSAVGVGVRVKPPEGDHDAR